MKGLSSVRRARLLLALVAAIGGLALTGSAGFANTNLPTVVNGKHVMWGAGQGYPSTSQVSANNLIYHGGLVETTPAVYVVYWGSEWQQGWSTKIGSLTYTNRTIENYVNTLFARVAGSAYAGLQTQYCQNIDPGFSCPGQPFAQYVTNPRNQLKGIWHDGSTVPQDVLTTGLAANAANDVVEQEAVRAAQHFGYNLNATYFIYIPSRPVVTGYNPVGVYCAYHSETSHTTGHGVRYAFLPYLPDQGAGCGQNMVNTTNDAFGHGYLDGYSIVSEHEHQEAVTDPDNQMGAQDGWNDASTSENGDKCAWTNLQNVNLNGQTFALQPLWSNEANGGQGGCAFSR